MASQHFIIREVIINQSKTFIKCNKTNCRLTSHLVDSRGFDINEIFLIRSIIPTQSPKPCLGSLARLDLAIFSQKSIKNDRVVGVASIGCKELKINLNFLQRKILRYL